MCLKNLLNCMKQQDNKIKILFLQLGTIGDMILATPCFRLIKEKYPDSELSVICGGRNFAVIENNPFVDNILILDKSPIKLMKFIKKLRSKKYNIYIDPKSHYSKESRIIANLVKAERKIGFNTLKHSLNLNSQHKTIEHFSKEILRTIEPLGILISRRKILPEIYLNADSELYTEKFINDNKIKNFILINISASREHKQWVVEKWIELINYLLERNYTIVLCYAPTEKVYAQRIYENCNKIFLFNSRLIQDIFSIVKRTNLIITPDTSLIHIASAFDKPLLALYSGIEEFNKRFAPLSELQYIIYAEKDLDTIKDISVKQVIEGFEQIEYKI